MMVGQFFMSPTDQFRVSLDNWALFFKISRTCTQRHEDVTDVHPIGMLRAILMTCDIGGGGLSKLTTFVSSISQTENKGASDQAITFCDVLRTRAFERADEVAFVFLNSRGAVADELTFAVLDRRARAIANHLAVNGLRGERALLMFPPSLDFVATLFACFYAGVVAVPVPFFSGKRVAERITSICLNARPAAVLTLARLKEDRIFCEELFRTSNKLRWILIDALNSSSREVCFPPPSVDDLALLQYTSGSTSSPKGVMLSHRNLIANSAMIADAFRHDENTRVVGWLPLFHDMGLIGHVLQPIYFGGLSVLMSPLSFLQRPALWLQAISTWKVTTSGGPTYAFDLCLRAVRDEQLKDLDLSSWRVAYCGSEKVRADVLDRFSTRFATCGFRGSSFLPCFGLAEATLLVSGSQSGTGPKMATSVADPSNSLPPVSCGLPGRGTSIVITDPETRVKLDDGAVGEIWVKGAHVGQGYWRAADSDDLFRARLLDGTGPYLRTGDLGFLEGGELFVVGRLKDTIIVNGLKHNAEDIEAHATRSHLLFEGFPGAAFRIDVDGQERAVLVQEVGRVQSRSDELPQAIALAFASVDSGARPASFRPRAGPCWCTAPDVEW